ncbi:transglycosylase SLT domain-containing protein [Legionella fairfieldensis]|uniref:transglycosylase SLT domain-containing protein n=1 Tax=Legionella fairfieldensis TaxID=45064 RepID=UPI00048CBD48|nr:transglycosylase SLT domain-containing protein [Legionella fairfieldensis]
MNLKVLILSIFSFLLVSCVSRPPSDVNHICHIFNQYPKWYRDAKDVEQRWRIPVSVQMAIIHQESKFDGRAKPPRTKLLWIIPWKRPSTAYGYTQALHSTWRQYKRDEGGGGIWAARDVFSDAVDFIGWYANQANRRAGISRDDAYRLYLAYHEGIGGYQRKTYLQKPWLIQVARKVKARSQIFQAQLNQCRRSY